MMVAEMLNQHAVICDRHHSSGVISLAYTRANGIIRPSDGVKTSVNNYYVMEESYVYL